MVLTRADGDRAILTYSGTMTELAAADVSLDRLRTARHVHVSSFFLQRGLQAGLPGLLRAAREAGATTSLDTGWAPDGEWASAGPALRDLDFLLPNAAECARLAAALDPAAEPADDGAETSALRGARVLHRLGPAVAVKLGAAGGLAVAPDGVARVRGRPVTLVDSTGAGDCFNAGFIAGVLDGSAPAEALARAVASGSVAVTGWGGTGRLATHAEAIRAAGLLHAEPITDEPITDDP